MPRAAATSSSVRRAHGHCLSRIKAGSDEMARLHKRSDA
jgi:hypothetical protein